MKIKINIGVTIGDVNGIGLEIFAKFLISNYFHKIENKAQITLFGNEASIFRYFKTLDNSDILMKGLEKTLNNKQIEIVNIETQPEINFGKVSKEAGKLALESISTALEHYSKNTIDCLVTLPICKESVQMNLPDFVGHTEFIAKYFKVESPLMTFVYRKLRVCLLTIHIPLSRVNTIINRKLIIRQAKIFWESLQNDFGIKNPKIAILGLNPHAGENGLIGHEEKETFSQAIESLKKQRIQIEGAFPSDGFFAFKFYKKFDGIIACYHDQGLIPFKILSKGEGVNFTANIPLVRTSPDHGTGFDIAGKNIANFQSLKNAINTALQITKQRRKKSRNPITLLT
ncbi:MAG: 4-hydroxythreonine-4-phosphate dehydrogenase PdxA [Candidatus Kapaibacteriota bacterium]|jgi:4-hydroxythreonine-4-phosphate dehydrogenase